MIVPSTTQYYVALKALSDVSAPMRMIDLVGEMKIVSRKEFGDESMFVFGPVPLTDLIYEMNRNGDVHLEQDRAVLSITEQGRAELANTTSLVVGRVNGAGW